MNKRFWTLLACLLMLTSVAVAECAICGGDGVCDTCEGSGYLLMQAFGSDEQIKVICPADCDNGSCQDCAAVPEATATPAPAAKPKVQGGFLNVGPKPTNTPKPTSKPLPTEKPTTKPLPTEKATAKPAVSGEKKITVEVFIGEDHRKYTVTTKETYLLDALLGCGLVEGEEVSWGFNVTIVDGVRANYKRNGEYWSILEYSGGRYTSMSDSIAYRRIEDGERYAFEMVR